MHAFYTKYVSSINSTTPEYLSEQRPAEGELTQREKFDYCIKEKLRMRNGAATAPFNSLQASVIACHAQQFPNFTVNKISDTRGNEVIYANGMYSDYLDRAMLTIQNPISPKPAAKNKTFGENSCLEYSSQNSACMSKSTICKMSNNFANDICMNNFCSQSGRPNSIYIAITNKYFGLTDLAFTKIQTALAMKASGDPLLDNKNLCVKCPGKSIPSEQTAGCVENAC